MNDNVVHTPYMSFEQPSRTKVGQTSKK